MPSITSRQSQFKSYAPPHSHDTTPPQTAKVFMNGRSQAVRLPKAFRFDCDEVYIRRDEATGEVILSTKPSSWEDVFTVIDGLSKQDKQDAQALETLLADSRTDSHIDPTRQQEEDIFADWEE